MLLYIPHHTVTNANNKPCYLILVENEADKILYKRYIQERTDRYDLMITSLEENNIPNEPKQIKEFLLEIRNTFPFYYAVFDERIAFHTILFYGRDWKKDVRSDNEYVNLDDDEYYIPEFYLGRITHSFLENQWSALPQQSVLFALPVLYYDHYLAKCRGYRTGWCDMRFFGFEYKKKLAEQDLPYIEMYENRYSYRQAPTNNIIQLNYENFNNTYQDCTIIISTSTYEPLIIDFKEESYDYSYHSNLYTATWDDTDDDKMVDFQAKEVHCEMFCDFDKLDSSKKQVWILPTLGFSETVTNLYCSVSRYNDIQGNIWFNRDNQGLRYSYSSSYKYIVDEFLKGTPISICVFDAFYQNKKKQPYTNFLNLTYFVYGPPETTMNDLTIKANLTILPKEIEDSSEIVFPINLEKQEFTIFNNSEGVLHYHIEFDKELVSLLPSEGSLEPNEKEIVQIDLRRNYSNHYSIPKPKRSVIMINSNAGNKRLTLKWKDFR